MWSMLRYWNPSTKMLQLTLFKMFSRGLDIQRHVWRGCVGQDSQQPPQPGVILSWRRQGPKRTTLPFVSPDIDRCVTGSSLLTGHHKMKANWGMGLGGGGVGRQMTSHMPMFCQDNTPKQEGSCLTGCISHNSSRLPRELTEMTVTRVFRGCLVCLCCSVLTVLLSWWGFFSAVLDQPSSLPAADRHVCVSLLHRLKFGCSHFSDGLTQKPSVNHIRYATHIHHLTRATVKKV